MSDATAFTVRPIPSSAALDGAFRVHIPPKDLESLGLRTGDLCTLTGADGSSGMGIAWRSNDGSSKPHAHPVKMTDTMRDAFGFKLGTQLTIQKVAGKIVHADRVVVIDVSDSIRADPTKDDDMWIPRCSLTLASIEAFTSGVAFEGTSTKGLKKRFLIEFIESRESLPGPNLYYFDGKSQIILQGEASAVTTASATPRPIAMTADGIGGLDPQIALINKRLARLFGPFGNLPLPRKVHLNKPILLFGPEGTGKTLVLDRLSEAAWKKVIRVDRNVLSGTMSKNQAALRNLFADATAHQPSLIIMDNVEAVAGTDQRESAVGSLAPALAAELDGLRGTHVQVFAATQIPNNVDKALRTPNRLGFQIEIPIPTARARADILRITQEGLGTADLAEIIGERTHGFVGQDLTALFDNALDHAFDRLQNPDWLPIQRNADRESLTTLVNGSNDTEGGERPDTASTVEECIDVQVLLEDYEKALLEVHPTAMREIYFETPKVYWSDIGGYPNIRQTLNEIVEWPIKHKEHLEALNLTPQKGVLLYGPPGCSKTLAAKAIATSSGLNFIAVKGAELTSMYVGETERSVREVFRKARAAAPSIIFFDEIDSIGMDRDSGGTKGLNVLTTLLNEMDGIEGLKGVLVLAATNRPEILDPALLRPGRFDSHIYVPPPSEEARREILRINTRDVPLAGDVNIDELAVQTEGFSGAEIVNICLEAARKTMRRRVDLIGQSGRVDAAGSCEPGKVSSGDFQSVLSTAVRRITAEMTEGYERWRAGQA